MMSSRLEPMSTTLMIDHRVYIHSPITGVMCGLHAVCESCDSAVYSFLEPGPTRAPATAGLTAGAMKPLRHATDSSNGDPYRVAREARGLPV